ncbi:hypothetical protein DESC_660112 [Desulfosarcina cetonica]|nr:hypothetical protein DESC_660112 [Desulfosarcina cetonica]
MLNVNAIRGRERAPSDRLTGERGEIAIGLRCVKARLRRGRREWGSQFSYKCFKFLLQ